MQDFRTLWDQALTFEAFLAASTKHKGLWEGIYGIARIPGVGRDRRAGRASSGSCW